MSEKVDISLDVQKIARDTINQIGYTKGEYMFDGNSCGVLSAIHEQSPDINQGVERANLEDQGAGDQGMMFGYATKETDNFMPLPLEISHLLLKELAAIRREGKEMTYLRPDSKSQVTIEYSDENKPISIKTIVISTQHDEFDEEKKMLKKIKNDILNILIPRLTNKNPDLEKIPHIGESHCLSFAHQILSISSQFKQIQPVLIMGGKAWHFANQKNNQWKNLPQSQSQQLRERVNLRVSSDRSYV